MSTFRALRQRPGEHPPAATVPLAPDAYATDYERRPPEPVSVGLRLLSETDLQSARACAVRTAVDMFRDDAHELERIEAYNDALMRELVARAACDPNDARTPFFPGDEEEVRIALTDDGVRYLYDELERVKLERSPLVVPASEDDVRALPATWARSLGMLPAARQRHLRRLVAFVLRALHDAEEEGATVDDAADGTTLDDEE